MNETIGYERHAGMTAEEYFGGVDPWATFPAPRNPEDEGWEDEARALDGLDRVAGIEAGRTGEDWRSVRGFEGAEGYEVSDLGRVRSLPGRHRQGRVIVGTQAAKSYRMVTCAGRRRYYIHELVLTAFHGPRPEGHVARHLNGDASDNRAVNLAWGTVSQNMLDSVAHGTHPQARKTHCPQGHPYEGDNVIRSGGRRVCRACRTARKAA